MAKGLASIRERVAALARPRRARGRAKAARKRSDRESGRAPRGSVPHFVGRVLDEHPGTLAAEIAGQAASDVERSIRLASIRVELSKGRPQGKYVTDNGRWSLAATEISGAPPWGSALSDPSPGVKPGEEATAAGVVAVDSGGGVSETAAEGGRRRQKAAGRSSA